jgi:hypothetical protein
VVENRAGAGGTIGTATVAKAEPDGHTILATASALTIAPLIYKSLPYDTVRELTSVAALGSVPNVLVTSPAKGLTTIQAFVAAAKAKPGSFNYASAVVGTATHAAKNRACLSHLSHRRAVTSRRGSRPCPTGPISICAPGEAWVADRSRGREPPRSASQGADNEVFTACST